MTRIGVVGAGFLGTRLVRDIPGAILISAQITEREDTRRAILHSDADVIVNAAGRTGRPNVDWCESHQLETYLSNVVGPLVLADVCLHERRHLVHIGSGCIFYGRSPHSDGAWREDDHANPVAYYSKTKYAADLALAPLPHVAVVRLRMPIDSAPHERNLITKLARYSQVIDIVNSVTVVDDLIQVVRQVAEYQLTGIFHAVNPGAISHREILALYQEYVDPSHVCEFIPEAALVADGLASKPRSNCILADTRLAAAGIQMRPISEALRAALACYRAQRNPLLLSR